MNTSQGKVFLIGAGPGDVELLTLKAVRALGIADVILMDALVNPEILHFARVDALVIDVGKRGGGKHVLQEHVHAIMLEHAHQGKVVARLKGGDPLIFARGGEELSVLRDAGVPHEIIPGITAGIAAAHALHAPLTHRQMAQSITFVTGHCQGDNIVNWQALVDSGSTIVLYMGMRNLGWIVEQLIAAGMSRQTPAAVVQSASRPQEKSIIASLDSLPGAIMNQELESPAIVIIGDVLSMAADSRSLSPMLDKILSLQEVR